MPIPGRRVVVALASMGAAAAVLTGCDSAPAGPVGANPRQVTVIGDGEVQGVPDTLTADVAVEAAAADVTAAMNQANDRQNSVLNALNASGIDAKDISTTGVSLQPQYGDNSLITGYRASNSIQIKIRKLDTASQVLANVVSAGGDATRINSVSYSIEDDSKLVTDARARAFNDAKQRAQQYAELSGLSLGKIISISEAPGGTPPPPPVPMPAPRGAMASAVPLSPGQQTVSFSVTAVWELS
ncbi:SIMPL domain-containing protein [Mycobacterium sp. shizuoka-1]|uniref:SIMPL domain-containing protein n=1 Tax=Mycobacterium sp. shizuoka-1 TaxID=2039281 RepID=UPI000C08B250|nr:SIMPL domain-containing protein [Mycobacterium sp. shizuoka-1]